MQRTLTALCLATTLALIGCSGSGSGSGERATETDDRTPAEVLHAAVDATLEAQAFDIDSAADLSIGSDDLSLGAEGAVDYENLVSDVAISLEQGSKGGELEVRADGERLWLRTGGTMVPAVPGGKTWVEGRADLLAETETFNPEGLVGVVLALLAAEDVEEGDSGERDGVTAREFTTTVSYRDAVEAAGDRAQAFRTSLNLTGQADTSELEIVAWVGDDDVIRDFDLDIQAGSGIPVDGTYAVEISDVGGEVDPPETPDAAEVLTGPSADTFLSQMLQ